MPFGPGILVSSTCLAGYVYWRFSFRQVTAALDLERAGKIDDARALLQGFLANRNPLTSRGESKARCRLLLARLERKAGDYESAVGHADRLLESSCVSVSVGIRLAAFQVRADALAWAGDLEGAQRTAEKALEQARGSRLTSFVPEIEGLLARILTWRGDLVRARELAGSLMEGHGRLSWYGYLRMAEIDRVAGDFPGASEWCRRLVQQARESVTPTPRGQAQRGTWIGLAHYHAARAAWLGNDLELAAEWLDLPDAPEQLPRSDLVGWWGLRAAVAADSGDRSTARKHLKTMEAAAGPAPAGYGAQAWRSYYAARVEMSCGNPDAAAQGVVEAIRNHPPQESAAELFYVLGTCLERTGNPGADGAYTCGARQPESFHFARLCRTRVSLTVAT